MFKLSNAKSWKTTVLAIVGGIVVLAGIIWPDKVDAATGQAVNEAIGQIVMGIGSLIVVLTGIFGARDG